MSFGPDPFLVDAVPRVITGEAWDELAAGLQQRVRALNAFVADAYGERRIVAAAVVPASLIDEAEGYEPDLQGRLPAMPAPVAVAGLDVVCDEHGTLRVLEDNCRTPSGYCYAGATRRAVRETLGLDAPAPRDIGAPLRDLLGRALRDLLGRALRDATPRGVSDPFSVVLSEGPGTATAWEHEHIAELTGAQLVVLDDLRLRDGRVVDRDGRRVDVIHRRSDENSLRDEAGELTATARIVLEPWLAGRVGLVNAFGTGIADDKLAHAYVPDMVRFYLGEEPLLESVRTLDLGKPETVDEVLGDLREYVIKPRSGEGGRGVVVCAHADDETLAEVAEALRSEPQCYIAQHTISLSEHPTITPEGRLEPRHIDLRPFIFSGDGWTEALPGGLTRVALERGTLVVNSSQHGGGKDTWVLF
ncbi:MAG TPA: circularly permuted type 2 ATP-grasp protein [Solirubrobacteraceae bacterium]|nr:circularly permuted type 2 ATP-grasp protein [Solirubrobacteraceae bacterium]